MAIGKLVKLLMKKGPTKAVKKVKAKEYDFPEENLDLYIDKIKEVNPDLGKDSQPPSFLRKTRDDYLEKYEEWKSNRPEARRKLKERIDNLNRMREEHEALLKQNQIEEIKRQERIESMKGIETPRTIFTDD